MLRKVRPRFLRGVGGINFECIILWQPSCIISHSGKIHIELIVDR